MLSKITVSPSPHISKAQSTRSIMLDVIIGLVPAMIAAWWFFRIYAVIVIGTCVISCAATEWLCNVIRKKPNSLGDFSAVVTGVILALSLPPAVPFWVAIIGSVFAIAIGKMVFGGLGSNIFNPAMAARVFLTASFGTLMTTWTIPASMDAEMGRIVAANTSATTKATPLAWSKDAIKGNVNAHEVNEYITKDAFMGNVGGCLGETCAWALLIGGAYLIIKKTINIHITLAVLISAFVFASIGFLINRDAYAAPWFHLVSGGLLLCAFFIATDPVTAPLSAKGMWIFGAGVGALVMLIRMVGGYPEGVMFAVLIMNSLTPLIDRLCQRVPSGGVAHA